MDKTLNQKFLLTKENIVAQLFSLSYYFIALVLLFSGISKIINPENFLKALNVTLGIFRENTIVLIATAFPVFEISLGLMLLIKIKVKETLIAVLLFFVAFTVFAIYGTIKGFDINCGCFGSSVSSEFGVTMIVRNVLLLVIVGLLYRNEKMVLIKD